MTVCNVRKGIGTFVDIGDPVVWILAAYRAWRQNDPGIGDKIIITIIIIIFIIIITDSNTYTGWHTKNENFWKPQQKLKKSKKKNLLTEIEPLQLAY